jgi:prepilin-type N-terminal cleavage/methylation domain-containing protein
MTILRIGNSSVIPLSRYPVIPFNRKTGERTNRQTEKGFTLLEIMVATAVLSLGIVLIYQAFFISLNSFKYYNNYLKVSSWLNEKIWEAQDNLFRLGPLAQIDSSGSLKVDNNNFYWSLSYGLIDEPQNLYKIDLVFFWQEGKRRVNLTRNAYALYTEKK